MKKTKFTKVLTKVMSLIFLFQLCITAATPVMASASTNVTYTVTGKTEVGNVIDIAINVSNVTDFYGGSVDFLYDTSVLEVQSITKGDILGENVQMPVNSVKNGQANIALTLTGDSVAPKTSGTLAIVKAKVLKEGAVKLNTTEDVTSLNLSNNTVCVKLANSSSSRIAYTFENKTITLGTIVPPVTVLQPGTYEENNAALKYTGTWVNETNAAYSNGMGKYSNVAGSTLEFTMKGTGFELYVPTATARGQVKIYVDGTLVSTSTQHNATTQTNYKYYTKTGLTDANHTVKVEVAGTKAPGSTSTVVIVDKIVITNGSTPQPNVLQVGAYEEDNLALKYTGTWVTETNSGYSNGVGRYSTLAGSSVEFVMNGTGFDLYVPTAAARGQVKIYVDDTLVDTVSQHNATTQNNYKYYTKTGLSAGNHTVKIEATGTKAPGSTNSVVIIDKIVVTGGASNVLVAGSYEQDNALLNYTGNWVTESASGYSNGSGKYSTSASSAVEFTMNGTGFELYVPTAPSRGEVRIYIDGTLVTTVTQHNATTQSNYKYYTKTGLTAGNHTVKIEVTGTKAPTSTHTVVIVDKIVIK